MDFSILWAQATPIPLHAMAALLAFALGVAQMVAPKGTPLHRRLGWIWVGLMVVVSVTGMFIHVIGLWGAYSPIHLLIPITLISLVLAIRAARRGNIRQHKAIMISLFAFALVLAGLFTLAPGRALNQVLFGAG